MDSIISICIIMETNNILVNVVPAREFLEPTRFRVKGLLKQPQYISILSIFLISKSFQNVS